MAVLPPKMIFPKQTQDNKKKNKIQESIQCYAVSTQSLITKYCKNQNVGAGGDTLYMNVTLLLRRLVCLLC